MLFSHLCVYLYALLSVFSISPWCLGFVAVCDCGTSWNILTFRLNRSVAGGFF